MKKWQTQKKKKYNTKTKRQFKKNKIANPKGPKRKKGIRKKKKKKLKKEM
jgi:hypothetical protein